MSNGQSTAIVKADTLPAEADAFMPVLSIDQAIGRRNAIVDFAKRVMVRGIDYGTIPGTEKKGGGQQGSPSNKSDTLLKPGAEKLCTLFGLVPEFVDYRVVEDWDKGLFYYAYICRLTRRGQVVGTGIGSANSREKKYRRVQRACPACGAATIVKSKFAPRDSGRPNNEGGWWCGPRDGGCGENFVIDDPAIVGQSGQVDALAACDQINTLQKMAQKRALVAACLISTNASEFFTQDVEDMEVIDAEWRPGPAAAAPPADPEPPAAVALASKEQVAQAFEYLGESGDPAKALKSVLDAAGVAKLDDMHADVMAEWLTYLKGKAEQVRASRAQQPAAAPASSSAA